MSSATTVCDRGLVLVLALVGACAAQPDRVQWNAPFGGSIGAAESSGGGDDPPGPVDSGNDHDDDGPPKPTGDPADGESSDTGEMPDDMGSSSGDDVPPDDAEASSDDGEIPPPADSGADGDPGVQPATGPWSSCEAVSCSVGMGCLEGQNEGAVCTVACAGFDPTSCPASPGDTVAPACISVNGTGVCALDCSGGLVCPTGMTCVLDNDDLGPIEVCL